MILQYGTVTLNVVALQRYERTAVYSQDGVDLLSIRHVLGATTEYSPGGAPRMPSVTALSLATQKRLLGEPEIPPSFVGIDPSGLDNLPSLESDAPPPSEEHTGLVGPAAPGKLHSGPQTDAELFLRLMQPRQKLILWAWDRQSGAAIRWLESPRAGFSVDAANGPFPQACDIIHASGEPNTIGVYWQVQTDLPPCPRGSDRFVLSHRWEMEHTYNDDFYLTRITRGTVVFHAGIRDRSGAQPDWFRNQFILTIPLGFKRKIDSIRQSSDGLTIWYQVSDTDQTVCFAPGDSGATQMQIIEQSGYTKPTYNVGESAANPDGGTPLIPGMPWTTPRNFKRGWRSIFGA